MCAQLFLRIAIVFLIPLILPLTAFAAPIVFSDTGADASGIQAGVDAFEWRLAALTTAALPVHFRGRREINWDGGGVGDHHHVRNPTHRLLGHSRCLFVTLARVSFRHPRPAWLPFSVILLTEVFRNVQSPRLFAPIGSNTTDMSFLSQAQRGYRCNGVRIRRRVLWRWSSEYDVHPAFRR